MLYTRDIKYVGPWTMMENCNLIIDHCSLVMSFSHSHQFLYQYNKNMSTWLSVGFCSRHKHFPHSLPLLPQKRTPVSLMIVLEACQMNHAPCQQPSDVGWSHFHPDIYPDNCRGRIISGQQITMQWWLQPVAGLGWWIDC